MSRQTLRELVKVYATAGVKAELLNLALAKSAEIKSDVDRVKQRRVVGLKFTPLDTVRANRLADQSLALKSALGRARQGDFSPLIGMLESGDLEVKAQSL